MRTSKLTISLISSIEISIQKSNIVLSNPVDGVKKERPNQQQPSRSCLADLTSVSAVYFNFCARVMMFVLIFNQENSVLYVLIRFDMMRLETEARPRQNN